MQSDMYIVLIYITTVIIQVAIVCRYIVFTVQVMYGPYHIIWIGPCITVLNKIKRSVDIDHCIKGGLIALKMRVR